MATHYSQSVLKSNHRVNCRIERHRDVGPFTNKALL